MKTRMKKPEANKLTTHFDTLLKNMITEDLRLFKSQAQFLPGNLQPTAQARLLVS